MLDDVADQAVFDGLAAGEEHIPLGKHIRFFGDGYQKSKLVAGRRYWRIPMMDGEFLVEDRLLVGQGRGWRQHHSPGGRVAGGAGRGPASQRRRSPGCRGVIAPFPGGVARSGSKVGSVYKKLKASTADAYCPTLRGRVRDRGSIRRRQRCL